jgi:ribonucleoside-diphosphate reductase alpha chain
MRIDHRFTKSGGDPYELFKFEHRSSALRNPDGTTVFEMNDVEVPESWSQVATDILAQKYFRKTGVPQFDASGKAIIGEDGKPALGAENSMKQVAHRLAGAWRHWGEKYKYFDSESDAKAFYDELVYMILNQMAAPNSPQWFNTGLHWAYGITGSKQGHYYVDPDTKELKLSDDAYSHPQPHACFIQSVQDDLINEGGIFDLALREARIFKYGSGTGSNFSNLRGSGEHLSGGGYSSGLMSFLKIFDRAAGAIKSGGTTRRAAKMVIVDIDHPDVEEFIEWKAKEEEKVAALVAGSKINSTFLSAIVEVALQNGTSVENNKELEILIKKAAQRGVPMNYVFRVLSLVDQGFTSLEFEKYEAVYEGEAYLTVSGQNSNNSIRVNSEFMQAVVNDSNWELKWRTDGKVCKVVKARDLWNKIALAAWKSADPGIQYDSTINEWHTCPKSGRINASNPCSEYMFLDDTACNLASLNLLKFYDENSGEFLVEDYRHAVRLWTIVLEISVLMAQFPSKPMAVQSFEFRTLGLGYANLGSLLMVNGIPYDSPEALAYTGAVTGILTAEAYAASAEMAKELGAFDKYSENREDMLRVIRNHRRAAKNAKMEEYEGLTITPSGVDPKFAPKYLVNAVQESWDKALSLGELHGYRNAQVTVLAPTGTIGLVMDCDTTGIEPDFAVVKYKKLSGGGYFKIVNQSVRKALVRLKYSDKQILEIEKYCVGAGTLTGAPHINPESLAHKGLSANSIANVEAQMSSAFDIKFVFNKWNIPEEELKAIGIAEHKLDDPSLNILAEFGFTKHQIEEANEYVCGSMTVEGAPYLKDKHLPIFDTANRCGKKGERYIQYMAHVNIMAAAQPFISGAISKTVNMPAEAKVTEIADVYMRSWTKMIKAIALYRDGSKLSQPLNTKIVEGLDEIVSLGDETTLDETKGPAELQKQIIERVVFSPNRQKLPKKRAGHIREAYISGHKVFLRTGEYEDGKLGEIFIDMYKEGASFRGLLNSFAILVSKALQYGVPLEELVDTFTFTRFDPAGPVQGHEAIKYATSILDYVFRSLGYDYLNRSDFVHVKAVDEDHHNGGTYVKHEDEPVGHEENENFPLSLNGSGASSVSVDAKAIGYTGEQCEFCGSIRVKRSGSCTVCEDCGSTSGCS